MSPIERAQIEAKADQADMVMSEYLRGVALKPKLQVTATRPLDWASQNEIRRVGVNMNQIAKRLNEGGSVPPTELQEASAQLRQIFDVVLAHIHEDW